MLSQEETKLIEEELNKFPRKNAACIEALKIVQNERRWISDEAVKDVAGILEMTPAEVDNVATFYNLIFRRPVGRHIILLCDSISCWVMDYEKILTCLHDQLGIRFGETTKDNRFTLLPIQCLGNCDHAPAMMVDNDLYHDLDQNKINSVLEKYQ